MNYLRVVSKVLKENLLFAMCSNCESWLWSVAFLGHIISMEGFMVDPTKNKAVKNWP